MHGTHQMKAVAYAVFTSWLLLIHDIKSTFQTLSHIKPLVPHKLSLSCLIRVIRGRDIHIYWHLGMVWVRIVMEEWVHDIFSPEIKGS